MVKEKRSYQHGKKIEMYKANGANLHGQRDRDRTRWTERIGQSEMDKRL